MLVPKLGASALRSAVQLADTTANGFRNWRMLLNGQDIGGAYGRPVPGGWQIRGVDRLPKNMLGMGLGKKLYGDIMRSLAPGERLFSDENVSGAARRVWESMMRRPNAIFQAQPQPGGIPNVNTAARPGGTPGLTFATETYNNLKSVLPQGLRPFHFSALRGSLPGKGLPLTPPGT